MSASNIGTDTLQDFKRLEFSDGTLALDIDAGETAGQAYRLYQAATRTPDMPGVAYHMNDMESNGLSIQQIALTLWPLSLKICTEKIQRTMNT